MARPPLTRKWTDEEITELKRLLLSGLTLVRIGTRLKRTPRSVEHMCLKLGLPTPAALKRQNDSAVH